MIYDNYLDLFHGIGGFPLGAYWAGMKFDNHFCSDIEKYPVELYKKRFPDSIQLGDITKIDFEKLKKNYPGDWILTGGFPCQDISVAGKGKGLIDEEGNKTRSGLWFDYSRAIRILRPRFCIIENVRALLNRGMDTVLSDLAEIRYNAEWQVISAANMGAPHKRERVWIMAYPNSIIESRSPTIRKPYKRAQKFIGGSKNRLGPRNEMANPGSMGQSKGTSINRENEKETRGTEPGINSQGKGEISNTTDKRLQREKPKSQTGRESRLSAECNRWAVEPDVGRLAHGVSHRVDRLKGLGNAIVPQIAELLFRQIRDYL